jgi:hypothetical protein
MSVYVALVLWLALNSVNAPPIESQTIPTFAKQTYASRAGGSGGPLGAKADLNNDGVPDLVLCCDRDNNAWYQLSTGTGGFLAPVTLAAVPPLRFAVATGDFNRDGRNDVLLVNLAGNVTIHYGKGDNVFAPVTYFAGFQVSQVAAADFNHDNTLDVAFIPVFTSAQKVQLFLARGDGKGSFAAPTLAYSATSPAQAENLVVGDFDGDRHADLAFLVTACFHGGCNPSDVNILYGRGGGGFTPKVFANNFQLDMVSFDVNQTGRSDLPITTGCTVSGCGDSIGVLFGAADRTLWQQLSKVQTFFTGFLAVADLNGDLRNDLIRTYGRCCQDRGSTEGALLALATSGSSWNKQIEIPLASIESNAGVQAMFAGDFTRDRKPDVVAYQASSGLLQVLVNTTTTGNYGVCSYPTTGQGIHVCSPTGGSTRHSPVRFTAAANSFQPIRKVELWIDGQKKTEQFRSWLDFTASLPIGTHRVTIFVNGYDDDFQRTTFFFTVN